MSLVRLVVIFAIFLASNAESKPSALAAPTSASAPVFSTATTAHFAVIGDYGYAGSDEQAVANLVKGWNPDFIITVGDNNYDFGAQATIDANIGQYYSNYIYPYAGAFVPTVAITQNLFFPSLGNHDFYTAGATPYLNYFSLPGNERYYDFVWGPVQLFALDSEPQEPDGYSNTSKQATWLERELAGSTAKWRVVYMHRPPYSSGATHGSTSDMQWAYQSWGANAILSGHEHNYERIVQNGFPYFVNGLGGKSKYSNFGTPVSGSQSRFSANYGAMLVTADETMIRFEFYSVANPVNALDTYTVTVSSSINRVYFPLCSK